MTCSAGVVTGLPFASCRATVTRSVETPSATLGEALPATASLLGAPLRTVVKVAEDVLTPTVFALAVQPHVPGVAVAVTVNSASPAVTVVGPPEPPPLMLQTADPLSRETVIEVVLSLVMTVPFASVTSTMRTDVEVGAAEIVPR